MSFWDGLNAGDMFEQAVGGYVEIEKARASNPQQAEQDQDALINRPDNVTQRPNAQPTATSAGEVSAGSGTGASRNIVLPNGLQLNRTAVYVAGAALGAVVLMKLMK